MDKELIEYLADKLQKHEAPYDKGAWERFAGKKETKKRGLVWWWCGSAAALFIALSSLLYNGSLFKKTASSHVNVAKNTPFQPEKGTGLGSDKAFTNPVKESGSQRSNNGNDSSIKLTQDLVDQKQQISSIPSTETSKQGDSRVLENIRSTAALSLNEKLTFDNNIKITAAYIRLERSTSGKLTFEEILARDSKIAAAQENNKSKDKNNSKKIQPDIYVASAMGNDNKVNMNYGFSLSYPIAKQLSVSSGVAYTSMSSKLNNTINSAAIAADAAPVSMSFASRNPVQTSKNLESVNASLTGLSIPLDLKYQLNSKLYAGVGISAIAVLTTNQQNVYNITQVQNTTFSNANGIPENRPLILNSTQSEAQPESVTQSQNFLGFYNLSFGYRQKLSDKTSMGLEPFFRIPMSSFSKDNLNLTNGGLRLKFDF